MPAPFFRMVRLLANCLHKTCDAGHILGAGTETALLSSSCEKRRQLRSAAHIQSADAFRSVDFVCRQADDIHGQPAHIQIGLSVRLDGIRMKHSGAVLFAQDASDRFDRHLRAGFVVGVHQADEDRVGGQCVLKHFGFDESLPVDRQVNHPGSLRFETLAGAQNGRVLHRTRDDGATLPFRGFPYAENRLIVAFCAAGRKNDFVRQSSDGTRDRASGLRKNARRIQPHRVQRRGIPIAELHRPAYLFHDAG